MREQRRVAWIDWTRALGACAIILLHVLVSTYQAYELPAERKYTYILLCIPLCRWAVPAFFMMTGYLLLDSERPLGWDRVRKYVMRMVLVILTFGLAFAFMEVVQNTLQAGERLSWQIVSIAVQNTLTGNSWGHLWYVYALLFVYHCLAAIAMLRERWGERAMSWLTIALVVLLLAVPTLWKILRLNDLVGWSPQRGTPSMLWDVFSGVTNACVGNELRTKRLNPAWATMGLGCLATMMGVSAWGVAEGWGSINEVYMHTSCFATGYAAFVLLAIRWIDERYALQPTHLVGLVAQDSFGIYVIHPLFVHAILMVWDPRQAIPMLAELGFFCVVLLLSITTTRLLRRVPLLGSLV